jgi:beta-glucanase (GH16 family)
LSEWSDEFDGDALGPDWETISSPQDRGGDHSAPVAGLGVTACRSADCRNENVQVKNGALHLLSERDPEDAAKYYTGAVSTRGRKSWKDDQPYRLCIRAKLPGSSGAEGSGIWPAHWMLPDNDLSEKCLDGGEMDIMEMVNGDSNLFSTYHWLSSWPKQTCGDFDTFHKSRNNVVTLQDYAENFHEFGVERSADHITYAVDGRVVHHMPASRLGVELSRDPFYLILNTAVGGSWPGEPTAATKLPTEHVIDYVRVVRRANNTDSSQDTSTMPLGHTDGASNWADHGLRGSSLFEMAHRIDGPPPMSVA